MHLFLKTVWFDGSVRGQFCKHCFQSELNPAELNYKAPAKATLPLQNKKGLHKYSKD